MEEMVPKRGLKLRLFILAMKLRLTLKLAANSVTLRISAAPFMATRRREISK